MSKDDFFCFKDVSVSESFVEFKFCTLMMIGNKAAMPFFIPLQSITFCCMHFCQSNLFLVI